MPMIELSKTNWRDSFAACMFCALTIAQLAHAGPELLLANVVAGGAERRCSSFTGVAQSRDCSADWDTILERDPAFKGMSRDDISFDTDYPAPTFTYALTPATLEALRQVPASLFDAGRKSVLVARVSRVIESSGTHQRLTWDAMEQMLQSPAQGLNLAEGAALRSALVERDPRPARKVQARSILFSSNSASVAIANQIVSAARALNAGKTPLIGVITASAGPHPFVDRDINVFALQSAGAEVVYLPLEGGFRQALDLGDCSNLRYYYDTYANTNPERAVYHADLQFPDLAQQQQTFCANAGQTLNATLNRLNGLYFSGGNQARHLESLIGKDASGSYNRPSAQLAILQDRHAQGKLVVAGTSAGNHIQGGGLLRGKPVPMIGGGDSYDVLRNGFQTGQGPIADTPASGQSAHGSTVYAPTLYPLGGLGVFRFGVLDSHFSQRAREARLIRATHDSSMDYGFGVDENTALLVSQPDAQGATHFSIVGAGGVFIADLRAATASTNPQGRFSIANVRTHYLQPHDHARIHADGSLHVSLSAIAPMLVPTEAPALAVQDRLLDYGASNFLNLTTAMARLGAKKGYGTTHQSNDRRSKQSSPYYSATLTRDSHTEFRGSQAPAGSSTGRASYSGLLVSFAPCEDMCIEPDSTPIMSK